MLGLMGFMFLFLLAFIAMFFFFIKKEESLFRQLSDEHAQLRVLLRAMECRLDRMEAEKDRQMEAPEAGGACGEDNVPGHDPLLHLSFEEPQTLDKTVDPALDIKLDAPEEMGRTR